MNDSGFSENFFTTGLFMLFFAIIQGCSSYSTHSNKTKKYVISSGESIVLKERNRPSEIKILQSAEKISQIVGDYDLERKEPTINLTETRYRLRETDLGIPFSYKDRTYLLFGDTHGAEEEVGIDRDVIAYMTDDTIENGVSLDFLHDEGVYRPVEIPGISMAGFEVPVEGVEVDEKMYVYVTTGHSEQKTMGRSVLTRSDDDGYNFKKIDRFSDLHFINVSIVKVAADDWKGIPDDFSENVLMIFGSGDYRKSDVFLAVQPEKEIENKNSIRYFAGVGKDNKPIWSKEEKKAIALFEQPEVGELSVTYNDFIDRWIMLYNAERPDRGINIRTAEQPWEWSESQVLYNPWKDKGYGHFIHINCAEDPENCDEVYDEGRKYEWGGEYGPYQYPNHATGNRSKKETTIYFNLSTWNPYTVVLMKARIGLD